MQITINNVDVQNKGKYQLAVVEYNTADGKTEKKNVVSFTNKALYSTLSTAAKSVQVDDVIKTAKQLEAYVFGKDQAQSEFVDMPEDIPTIE
jgi:hypothetical protein